jgi:hypothetical protein
MLPDFDRADAISTFCGHPETRTFGELLIDLEEDKAAGGCVRVAQGDGAKVARAEHPSLLPVVGVDVRRTRTRRNRNPLVGWNQV